MICFSVTEVITSFRWFLIKYLKPAFFYWSYHFLLGLNVLRGYFLKIHKVNGLINYKCKYRNMKTIFQKKIYKAFYCIKLQNRMWQLFPNKKKTAYSGSTSYSCENQMVNFSQYHYCCLWMDMYFPSCGEKKYTSNFFNVSLESSYNDSCIQRLEAVT